MATQPGFPPPDIDEPQSPAEAPPAPDSPDQPGAPEEFPGDTPDTDVPDTGPVENPPPIGDGV